jgi:GNAT superfamily N-acetyltransferase
MPATDVTIHYLELTSQAALRGRRSPHDGVVFARVPRPMPELNRFFYAAIGGDWFWLERRSWTLAQWTEWTGRDQLETWVLSVDGVPAGYVELERRSNGDVEVMYFGLLAAFVGRGLGAHLLTEAVDRAWAMGASRVILNTCNLDHPNALGNYLARGFREYRVEVKRKEVPVNRPGPWEGAEGP